VLFYFIDERTAPMAGLFGTAIHSMEDNISALNTDLSHLLGGSGRPIYFTFTR
jgi:hypothetical protein